MKPANHNIQQSYASINNVHPEGLSDDALNHISAGGDDPFKKLLAPIAKLMDDFIKLFPI